MIIHYNFVFYCLLYILIYKYINTKKLELFKIILFFISYLSINSFNINY